MLFVEDLTREGSIRLFHYTKGFFLLLLKKMKVKSFTTTVKEKICLYSLQVMILIAVHVTIST